MDINDIRSALTLAGFVLFLALVRWVWAVRRRAAFDEAARLPLLDDDAATDRPHREGGHE
jgi:cytochrome c oxidase cbb3-type subunit IV